MIELDWVNATDRQRARVAPMLARMPSGQSARLAVRPRGGSGFDVELTLGEGGSVTRVRLHGEQPVELVDRALSLLRFSRPDC